MGEDTVFGSVDSGNGNLLLVQDATLSEIAYIVSLSFYVVTPAGDLRLGIYDATGTGGNPGNLVAETDAFTPGAGWNTVPVLNSVQLPAGNYWLAYFPSDSALSFAKNPSAGSYRVATINFGPLPSSFPPIAWQGTTHWSFYATLNSAPPVPDSIPPTIDISAPADGALVNGIVNITADADDNIGVVGVQFFVDSVPAGVEDSTPPYGYAWDTRTVSNGVHTLTATARDAALNTTTSAPIDVNVLNNDSFQNEILATGFNLPTAIKFLPDGRMLVTELPGTIKVLPPPYTTPDPTPFLELNLNIPGYAGLQQGIFDIAFDPNFETNNYYYIFYTDDSPKRDRLSRFTANATLDGTVPGSEFILYEDPQDPNTEHHGGAINFGNDGKIYFTTGEHFNAAEAQDLTSPRGKVHRINPDGTVPTDNPFYDGAGPNWDSIWAYGLRNPFRAYYDSPSNKLYIADVGGNNYSTAYEEIDLGAPGANYGWPDCEFGTCGNPNFTAALYAYPHNGRDASITGGFVYRGTQYPAAYQGNYFYADYAQNWIKYLTFDAQGIVNGVFNFEPLDGTLDGPYGDMVYLTEGPDGALYYVDLGYSDIGGTFGVSKIRRIRYVQANQQPTANATANPLSGPVPLTVTFSSAGSFDPEGEPLTYAWDFGDGATSTEENPLHTYGVAGHYTARLTVSDGTSETLATPLQINVGNKPVASITTPLDGWLFIADEVINFSGEATDTEDGVLPASAFTWDIDFLHAGHVHPDTHLVGATSGTFTIPTSGHDFSGDTRYRITLTVADSDGLIDTQSVTIYPDKVNITLESQTLNSLPLSLDLKLDGIPYTTPFVYDTLIDFQHTIEATSTSEYTFSSWSDGGAQQHTLTAPNTDTTYTATFEVETSSTPITMGEDTVFGSVDSGNGNLLLVQDATLSEAANIESLSFYVVNPAGDLRLGVYDAAGPGGNPGNLVAETDAFAPAAGWNTVPVLNSVLLPAGNYWLAYFPSDSALSFAKNPSTGSYRVATLNFGPMPSSFPPIGWQGTTQWSFYATLNTISDTTPPSVPTNFSATAASSTQIDLTWDASTDNVGVTGYQVFRDGAQVDATTTTTYNDTGLTANTTYSYTVTAFDAAGNVSAASSAILATTLPQSDTEAPSVPTGLQATNITENSVTLAWDASADNVGVTGYQIFRDGAQVDATTTTTYNDTGLTANTPYSYTVTAFDAAGNVSAASSAVLATTLPQSDNEAPSVPTGLQATNITENSATLAWDASTDNVGVTGYQVFRDGAQVDTTTTTTYLDLGLAPQTSYTYAVTAYDSSGNISAQSPGIQVTTTTASPIVMGETTVFGSVDSGNGNLLLVQDATLSETAYIESLSFYVVSPAGNLRLGIYDATGTGGNPGNLVAETNAFTPAAGWNTVPVTTAAQLPAGNYWLAYFPSDSALSFAKNPSIGSYRVATINFGPMPSSFPPIAWQGTTRWSFYGTLTP